MKYVVEGSIGLVTAIAIAAAGVSWTACLVGGFVAAFFVVAVEALAWRRSHAGRQER
jgi:hypothetical protein